MAFASQPISDVYNIDDAHDDATHFHFLASKIHILAGDGTSHTADMRYFFKMIYLPESAPAGRTHATGDARLTLHMRDFVKRQKIALHFADEPCHWRCGASAFYRRLGALFRDDDTRWRRILLTESRAMAMRRDASTLHGLPPQPIHFSCLPAISQQCRFMIGEDVSTLHVIRYP